MPTPNATQIMRNGSTLLATRDTLLAGQDADRRGPLRAEIKASWQRSIAHGVRPDQLRVPHAGTAEGAGALRAAAGPVADAVGVDLAGTGVSLLVSDQEARIVERRVPDAGLRAKLDRIGLAPGFSYSEEAVGTTAISIALRQRGPAVVASGEHYADTLTAMVCAAAPVSDPRTGRVVGIIGLACLAPEASPLMVPLVKRAARDVERRLTDGCTPSAGDDGRTGITIHEERAGWARLTRAELGVAAVIAEGATNREAAARLYLSPHTIDFHLRQIFRKLGVTSRVELTRLLLTRDALD